MSDEMDWFRRARANAGLLPLPGTIASLDYYLGEVIEAHRPVALSPGQIRHHVAVYWLRRERPRGFFERFRWAWRLLRMLWR